MDFKMALQNIKTTASGILCFLLSVPCFIQALEDLGAHRRVNWGTVAIGVLAALSGHGFINAKDDTTHSTNTEVAQSTQEAKKAQ